jgi:hypothetical protein
VSVTLVDLLQVASIEMRVSNREAVGAKEIVCDLRVEKSVFQLAFL